MTNYPSDWVPAPRDHIPGETEFERAIRLEAESERRFREFVLRFAAPDDRVPCACPPAGDYSPQDVADGRTS
jgi:hypothetical protein